jgi:pimeloyl-ACP methyl ester carboxylesterase
LPLLPRLLRLISPDMRGHVRSDGTPRDATGAPEGCAERVMTHPGVRAAILACLVIGGMIGQGLVARRPDLIRGAAPLYPVNRPRVFPAALPGWQRMRMKKSNIRPSTAFSRAAVEGVAGCRITIRITMIWREIGTSSTRPRILAGGLVLARCLVFLQQFTESGQGD